MNDGSLLLTAGDTGRCKTKAPAESGWVRGAVFLLFPHVEEKQEASLGSANPLHEVHPPGLITPKAPPANAITLGLCFHI